jgi:hypothetical protein
MKTTTKELPKDIDKSDKKLLLSNVSLLVCTCKHPRVEKCVLSGILFCMNCIRPMQTGS